MAEAIVSRYTHIPEDVMDPIPVTPSTHGIKVTLKDPEGMAMVDWPINCKDGSNWYNYKTNEKGQTIFSITSGAANISINNYNGQYQILDFNAKNINVDAPIGMTTRLNVQLDHGANFYDFERSKLFEFRYQRTGNIAIVGGGGGGGGGDSTGSDDGSIETLGAGGGAGYMNTYNDQALSGQYNFIVGAGGAGGQRGNYGGAGGTSYIVNTSYRANGGGGGEGGWTGRFSGGKGGLGNGGNGGEYDTNYNGGKSPVNFAGGGGAGGSSRGKGGSPYGANSNASGQQGLPGSRGGGGSGSGILTFGSSYTGGRGGSGLLRINIIY